jgi:hypothetical protein
MEYVQNRAWGHHASCTCAIGARDRGGVLSGDFKVHGVEGLRVVDASVFPRAPGLFIVSAIYMIGEKAADVIIEAKRAIMLNRSDGVRFVARLILNNPHSAIPIRNDTDRKERPGVSPRVVLHLHTRAAGRDRRGQCAIKKSASMPRPARSAGPVGLRATDAARRSSGFAGKDAVPKKPSSRRSGSRRHKDKRDGGGATDVSVPTTTSGGTSARIAKQPSLVVDPPDGRIPAQTQVAQDRIAERRNKCSPEGRPLAERCVSASAPDRRWCRRASSNNVQIVQTRGRGDHRDDSQRADRRQSGRQHPPSSMRFLTGDSVGRWDGDTLLIDTASF